uniref:Exporter protein n=1 Tax=Chlorobium limicola TaxID=1092 RepID=P94652_CHLLI|nr:pilus assembly protein N-terminal domain-containing protein [Chlorobium limicola]AAB36938.1 exporter protein [Chlorobium limicola]
MDTPSIYRVPLGESRIYRFAQPIKRVAVGDPQVADYIMMNRSEIYLLGKKLGSTNLVVWDQKGNVTSTPVQVSRGTTALQAFLKALFPKENDIHIDALGPALVLSGSVSDALVAESVIRLVTAYFGGSVSKSSPESALIGTDAKALTGVIGELNKSTTASNAESFAFFKKTLMMGDEKGASGSAGRDSTRGVINLLKVRDPQQVRLEVRIAQVSRSYLESLGLSVTKLTGDLTGSLGKLSTGFVSDATLDLLLKPDYDIKMGAKRKPSLLKILAEPTIVTMSGKEGYFLVGGKIYTPSRVESQLDTAKLNTKNTPTAWVYVLRPSCWMQAVFHSRLYPRFLNLTRNHSLLGLQKIGHRLNSAPVSTAVEMNEGENLVIGGLKLDNLTNAIDSVPLLGEIPILGALFRNTDKNAEKTELMVIVRPTLVKASNTPPELPTDKFVPPTRGELFFGGKLEGSRKK